MTLVRFGEPAGRWVLLATALGSGPLALATTPSSLKAVRPTRTARRDVWSGSAG